jgi:3-hydroxyisobutyrate dehydrogenase-like beta-hydroxyacid dehydrogenase
MTEEGGTETVGTVVEATAAEATVAEATAAEATAAEAAEATEAVEATKAVDLVVVMAADSVDWEEAWAGTEGTEHRSTACRVRCFRGERRTWARIRAGR